MCKKEKSCPIGRVLAIIGAVVVVVGALTVAVKLAVNHAEQIRETCQTLKAKLLRKADDESADYAD